MNKKAFKFKNYVFVSLSLSLFLFLLIIFAYGKKISPNVMTMTNIQIKKNLYQKINQAIKSVSKEEVFTIYKNKNDEILYVDYDLTKTYKILDQIHEYLNNNVNYEILSFPLWSSYDNVFLTQIGPKIDLKVDYIKSLETKVYTKVTEYGLNNALIEVYLKINVESQIASLFIRKSQNYSYDMLLCAKVVNGQVPKIVTSNDYLLDTSL